MDRPHFLKNLPTPVRMLIRPMLLFSLGMHGLLLLLPIASPKPQPIVEQEKTVKVTQLPKPSPVLPTPSPQVSPQPTPKAAKPSPIPQPSVKPSPKIQPIPQISASVRPTPEASPTPTPEVSPSPTPTPEASPSPTPPPEVSPSPTPTPEVEASLEPSPTPEPASPFAEFPHVTGATSGCEGWTQCWQADGERSTAVATTLRESLEQQGFEVVREDSETPGERIYRVSRDGKTQYYISLFSTPEGGTKYALADKPLTREQIQQQAETSESQVR